MQLAVRLALRGLGHTSPNPIVGAVLVKKGAVIGQGWHRKAGGPHAEIEAIRSVQDRGKSTKGATLYVTLEPCSTHGRTPPCTSALIAAGINRVVIGTPDPNPKHAGRAIGILRRRGIVAETGILESECRNLNLEFNHWIVHQTPFVTVKAAMTLDGKIATESGESKWITGEKARAFGMRLRRSHNAILVGVNTVLADDPSLTVRRVDQNGCDGILAAPWRIVLDSKARTPLSAGVISDPLADRTIIVVGRSAPKRRTAALASRVKVWVSPPLTATAKRTASRINLRWLLKRLGREDVTSLLVEGGGEVNAAFLLGGLAHRVAFFYAPKILGGSHSRKSVAGTGIESPARLLHLTDLRWRGLGDDLLLTAEVAHPSR